MLRVKFDDPAQTWVYIDPEMSQVLARDPSTESRRALAVQRTAQPRLRVLVRARPLWDVGMIALCLGGLASSGIGLLLGIRRMRRGARAMSSLPRLSQSRRHASDST